MLARERGFLLVAAIVLLAITVLMLWLAAPASAILGCGIDPGCIVGKAVGGGISSVAGDAITALAKAVLGALGHAIEWASTLWIGVGTPSVTDSAGQSAGTVSFLQHNLLVYTTGLAVLSTLIGAGRIVYHEHKATQLRELVRFLATYTLVSAGAATAASVVIGGADQMAAWFINQADAGSSFSTHLAQLLGITGQAGGFTTGLAATATTAVIAIVLGLLAFLGSVIQIMLMLVRGGMLVLLVGTLPLIAAFSNTEMGHQWFRKAMAWLLAFALYKPAAAIIYAVAFKLGGQQGALALLDGVMMLILSILALPALLRFLVPATSALAAGGGTGVMLAGAAGAAAMRMPSGAAAIQSAASTSYQQGQARSTGATGAASHHNPSGANGAPGLVGAGGSAGQPGAGAISGQRGTPGAQGQGGQAGAGGALSGREGARPRARRPVVEARRWASSKSRRAPARPVTLPTAPSQTTSHRAEMTPGPAARTGLAPNGREKPLSTETQTDRTYGNWRRPRPPGLWHLGLISSVLLIAGVILVIGVIALVGLLPGLLLLVVMLPFFLLTLKPDVHGQTPLQRVGVRAGRRRARLGRSHLYRSGPLGQTPHGSYQLPGLLAASQLSEARDAYDRPFAVLCHPWVSHLTVVIETEPDGAALVDQPQVDQWVAHYGHWLAALSEEPGLLCCQVCVETAPDPGRLRHAIAERHDPHAPHLATDTLNEIVNTYPAGAADLKARIALTFDMTGGGQRKSATELAREIATRLGGLTQRLHATGAGVAVPVDAQRLCEIVHCAYNPRAAELLEEARAAGQPARLRWEDAGPAAAEAGDQSYWHDGAESVTWAMTQAPRGEVRENVLARLIAPHPEIARKRVTLLYRMIGPGEAARIVERDLHNAEFRVNSATKPTARAILEQHSARATAQEEARGAALHNFGMLVTATVLEPEQLPAARSAISNLAPTARVALRPVWGSQDSAFAAALPVGLFLPAHLRVPESVRAAL